MIHRQFARQHIELEPVYSRHRFKPVADQPFFCGAIHLMDTVEDFTNPVSQIIAVSFSFIGAMIKTVYNSRHKLSSHPA